MVVHGDKIAVRFLVLQKVLKYYVLQNYVVSHVQPCSRALKVLLGLNIG